MNLIDALCEGWEEAMSTGEYAKNACILGTKVGIETLRYFGIEATAVPTALYVGNEKHSVGVHPDVDPSDPRRVTHGGYPAHLVILTQENLLIDLTLAQVNRPQHGIELHPIAVAVPESFTTSDEWVGGTLNGCDVHYQARLDLGTSYRDSPDWKKNYRPLVGPIIRLMKGAM